MARLGTFIMPSVSPSALALGDMFYYDAKATVPGWQRLTIGTAGQTLKVVKTGSGATERLLPGWVT